MFPHDPGERYLVPVVFVHGEAAIVVGTTTGVVNVWDRMWSHKIQGLHHEGECIVYLSASLLTGTPEKDRILALAVRRQNNSVCWTAALTYI